MRTKNEKKIKLLCSLIMIRKFMLYLNEMSTSNSR